VAQGVLEISTLVELEQLERSQLQQVALEGEVLVIQAQVLMLQETTGATVVLVVEEGVLQTLVELAALVAMAWFIFITKERNGYTIPISMSHL
jgi:hypothetical protein